MTRIIGGKAGGRRIAVPRITATRPTSDKVREALFSSLESELGGLEGLRFLDLYAGSGAIGLEAWSRGAGVVTFVESDKRAATVINHNADAVGLHRPHILTSPVATTLRRTPSAPYDVVFTDPPYGLAEGDVDADLRQLVSGGWISSRALLIVERSSRSPAPRWPDGVHRTRAKVYGETTLWYGNFDPSMQL